MVMTTKVLFSTVLVLLLFFPGPAWGRDPLFTPPDAMVSESAAALNDQGVQLYYEGRLEEALSSFIMASEMDPYFAVAHYNCAVVFTTRGFKGDLEEAIRHLDWAYGIDPFNQDVLNFLEELIKKAPLTT
jgi:tetratricopeptide (TPR) repeat protein